MLTAIYLCPEYFTVMYYIGDSLYFGYTNEIPRLTVIPPLKPVIIRSLNMRYSDVRRDSGKVAVIVLLLEYRVPINSIILLGSIAVYK